MLDRNRQHAKAKRLQSPWVSATTDQASDAHAQFPVVGIGASAGGLDACTKLVSALPPASGMALILVQHLDPTHESLMVNLLAEHTAMTVCQAVEGMPVEPNHLYVIPPGTYLSVSAGALHLTPPRAPHGARLPVDFLLSSLAGAYGARAVGVILSGTGADGSVGLMAIKAQRGLVIAQDPDEADYDGMPQSAIATGSVDLVLPVAEIPAALVTFAAQATSHPAKADAPATAINTESLGQIIELVRTKTAHDFTLYKLGTLQRRIERRMAMASIEINGMDRYLDLLRNDENELELLSKDLLINVTSFFRDPKVFEYLAAKIVPDLVGHRTSDQPLRVWIAGCSTGEETYSLTMLFREAIAEARSSVKLQVFASDVDPDAVAEARNGLYPETIAADVSPERLARFFTKEDNKYRVSPELRGSVVFTVQDVLADAPFSRLDMVSCRNLLIYLRAEAQAKVISIFHFALREGGILFLGNAETVGNYDGRFAVIANPERLYRHITRSRPGEIGFSMGDGIRPVARSSQGQMPSRQAALAELCRRLVIETHAPAAVLINQKHESLFSLGPTDRYLRVPPGNPSNDLLAMARDGMRTKLRAAVQQALLENKRIMVPGGRTHHDGINGSFQIDIQPVLNDGEQLLLVCFVDALAQEPKRSPKAAPGDGARAAELERELDATKGELRSAIRNLEIANEEQTAINEEALSVNEEYQSTNEELLTSKEELQSLNEELTALNGQLQETLDRQRVTANDLQNVLFSTDVATVFLDTDLNIRFFTPATKSLFNVIPSDIGRPLADLNSLAADSALLGDARTMLKTHAPSEREIEGQNGAWYVRRILPYLSDDKGVEGVVITFTDITERKNTAKALESSKQQADLANIQKSRFLAAASHDLRQPLQTMTLLQGLLARKVRDESERKLVGLLEQTLGAMAGMLNTLLDINQIDAGTVQPDIVSFPIGKKLTELRDEFSYHAQAKNLSLHVLPCSLFVLSDHRLLEQMVRNLLSNAIKYTLRGKILLGCRRHGDMLRIEVWDTGIGIPDSEFQAIFEEYHQLDNGARERARGLGLGLSIVRRLGNLLGHHVQVRSHSGKGTVFSIDVPIAAPESAEVSEARSGTAEAKKRAVGHRTGMILVVDDDPDVRDVVELVLKDEGHAIAVAADGASALELIMRRKIRPDLILTDFNLPNGMDGVQFARRVQQVQGRVIPVIILTGDISTVALREISAEHCVQLNKPVKLAELTATIQRLLPPDPAGARQAAEAPATIGPVIFVVDDEAHIRNSIRTVLEADGRVVEDYASCEAFLAAYRPGGEACLLIDGYLPGMTGLELLKHLSEAGHQLPAIMITGNSDVSMAVRAMKAGASDFIEKPITGSDLLASIDQALEHAHDSHKLDAWKDSATVHLAGLTPRQRQIMEMVLAGHPSKNIAADLGISQRTVENHRAAIMKKSGSKSLPALARLALAAAWRDGDKPPA